MYFDRAPPFEKRKVKSKHIKFGRKMQKKYPPVGLVKERQQNKGDGPL